MSKQIKERLVILRTVTSFFILLVASLLPWTINTASSHRIFLPSVMSNDVPLSPIVPPTTKTLTPETLQCLSSISNDGTLFTFEHITPQLMGLSPGDIIAGDVTSSANNGFLRKVSSVSYAGGGLVVQTAQAVMEEAIKQGEGQVSYTLTPNEISKANYKVGASLETLSAISSIGSFSLNINNVVLYDMDGDPATTNDQIVAKGNIELSPSFNFKLAIQNWRLQDLSFTATANITSNLKIESNINIFQVSQDVELARFYMAPITLMIGPVPVVISPVLIINVGVEGNVSLGVSTGVTQNASIKAGVQYIDGDWSPVHQFTNQFQFVPPTLSAGLTVKGYTSAQLSLLLYGAVGPNISINPYLELEANPMVNPWWQLYAGLEVPAGVNIDLLSHVVASYKTTVIDYKVLITKAQSILPDNISVSPTSGNWSSSPQNINVTSANASNIYYTIRATTDGTTPPDPPEPTTSMNDGSISGSGGTFQVYANPGQNKKLKVRFRGYNSAGYGSTTNSYLYSINISLSNPTIAMTPMSGPPGTIFAEWGTGFTPNSTAVLHFQKPDGSEYPTANQGINSNGTFSINYTAPSDKAPGIYKWWAIDATGVKSNIVTYTITSPAVNPTIAMTPMSGPGGTVFVEWGTGFTPNSTATLYFPKYDGINNSSMQVQIDAIGHFEVTYTSGSNKPPGSYKWYAEDGPTGILSNEVNYTITVNPTIAMSPMSGHPGTVFVEWGTGFTPNSTATLYFPKYDGINNSSMQVQIDAIGHFEVTYTSGSNKPKGSYSWYGIDGPTGKKSNTVTYVINYECFII